MVFKLVRTDAQEPCKIQLSIGTHMIGRGKFLDCQDKRVSRNHGELYVTEDSVVLKALHQNPCFYTKKGYANNEILKHMSTATLNNGDQFGLLPDSFWYEVIHCPVSDTDKKTEELSQASTVENMVGNETTDNNSQQALNFDMNESKDEGCQSPSMLRQDSTTEERQDPTSEETLPEPLQPEPQIESPEINDSPSIQHTTEATKNDAAENPVTSANPECQPVIKQEQHTEEYGAPQDSKTPLKRNLSTEDSNDGAKKIKTKAELKQEPEDAQAGPSGDHDQIKTNDSNIAQPANLPPTASPAPRPRERCMYGASCYRRNPHHKSEFSHPTDADWGTGERGVCPYGAGCRRTEPRHWRDHDHPPGVLPPGDRQRPGMQVVQRHGNIFFINNANAVNFYDDHFQVEDSEGDSVDHDYEF